MTARHSAQRMVSTARRSFCWSGCAEDRPALVISADALNRYALDVCVVPMTSVERPKFSLRVQVKPGEARREP